MWLHEKHYKARLWGQHWGFCATLPSWQQGAHPSIAPWMMMQGISLNLLHHHKTDLVLIIDDTLRALKLKHITFSLPLIKLRFLWFFSPHQTHTALKRKIDHLRTNNFVPFTSIFQREWRAYHCLSVDQTYKILCGLKTKETPGKLTDFFFLNCYEHVTILYNIVLYIYMNISWPSYKSKI